MPDRRSPPAHTRPPVVFDAPLRQNRPVDGFAGEREGLRPGRVLKLAGIVVAALLVVVAAVALAVALWLRSYAPLDAGEGSFAPGPGVGAVIQPATGSGGKEVFFPAYRRGRKFVASFTLHNAGHFNVTVEGLVPAAPESPPWIGPVGLLTTDTVSTNAPVGNTRPFRPFVLAAGDTAVLVASFEPICPRKRSAGVPAVYTDSLTLRYRYARWFTRTEKISLPFAVTLRCVGGPLAKP